MIESRKEREQATDGLGLLRQRRPEAQKRWVEEETTRRGAEISRRAALQVSHAEESGEFAREIQILTEADETKL